jgi:hypothetical protein
VALSSAIALGAALSRPAALGRVFSASTASASSFVRAIGKPLTRVSTLVPTLRRAITVTWALIDVGLGARLLRLRSEPLPLVAVQRQEDQGVRPASHQQRGDAERCQSCGLPLVCAYGRSRPLRRCR